MGPQGTWAQGMRCTDCQASLVHTTGARKEAALLITWSERMGPGGSDRYLKEEKR